jgi:photosystem II stability/assembly factor-like uncharacterized protein
MSQVQSPSPGRDTEQRKPSVAKRSRKRFLSIGSVVLLLAAIVIVWQFLNATLNSTDPRVAGRPLSNPHTHLHTIAPGGQPGVIYLGTHFGLFTSTDGGQTWPQPRGVLNNLMIMSIAVSPANPRVLAIITLPSGGIGTQSGIFFSQDGGANWQHSVPPGLSLSAYPYTIKAGTGNAGHFYAFYQFAGWFETQDMGAHWHPIINKNLSAMETPTLLTDPSDPNHLLLGGDQGLFESRDDGNTWHPVSGVTGTVFSMVASTTTPRLIFCATDHGLYRWQEGSTRVTRLANAPSSLTRLLTDPAAHHLYGVSGQDLWFSANSGATWVHRYHFNRGDLVALVVDPWHPDHLYAGFFLPALAMYSLDGGSSWKILTD